MPQQTRYNSLDVMKMFMAFLVVGIHVGTITNTSFPAPLEALLSTAVPFFFCCSGFFLQNKIIKTLPLSPQLRGERQGWGSGEEDGAMKGYLLKTLKLYVLWHLVYLPVDLRYMFRAGHTLWEDLGTYFYMFFCKGETYFTWPLWYLHGLIVAVIIIWVLRKMRLPLPVICLLGIIVMILGHAGRNGLTQGFPCVAAGMLIRQYIPRLPYGLKDRPLYPTLRLHSMLIYFLHMYFVLIMFTLYKDNQHPYLSWAGVFLVTWLAAFIIDKLRKRTPFRWINHLIS